MKKDFNVEILQGKDISTLVIKGTSATHEDVNKVWLKISKSYKDKYQLDIMAQFAFDSEKRSIFCIFRDAGDYSINVAADFCSELRHYSSQGQKG